MMAATENPSMTELFNAVAASRNLGTIMQAMPTGECMVWVTNSERDPMKALLSAALAIMVKRGTGTDSDKGVSIRKVIGVHAPGSEYYWKVMDSNGNYVADGYAATHDEAATHMSKHLLPNL